MSLFCNFSLDILFFRVIIPGMSESSAIAVPHHNRKIDLHEALVMRFKNNMSFAKIGEHFGVSRNAVSMALKKLVTQIGDPRLNEAFAAKKVEALSAAERILYQALIDPKKIEDASLNNVAFTFKVVNEANRLEKGLATSNVDVVALTGGIEARSARINQLKSQLALAEGGT